MTLSLVVEDGTGLANANSYVTVAEADAYFAPDVNFLATWNALSDAAQDQYLVWATRILDQKTKWRGDIASSTQSLRWPRNYARTRDNQLVDNDIVPEPVKAAVCELVKYLQENDPTTGPDTDNLKSLKVDVIEIAFQPKAVESNFPSIINAILRNLGVFMTGGASFGRITRA